LDLLLLRLGDATGVVLLVCLPLRIIGLLLLPPPPPRADTLLLAVLVVVVVARWWLAFLFVNGGVLLRSRGGMVVLDPVARQGEVFLGVGGLWARVHNW